jgi:ATP-dependent Lhr-like helicase
MHVDQKAKKIDVLPAKDGKKPIFYGSGSVIHSKIREKMLEILYSNANYDFLDRPGHDEIELLRKDFSVFKVQNTQTDRLLLQTENHLQFFSFTGTKTNRTLGVLFDMLGIQNTLHEHSSTFDIAGISKQEFLSEWIKLHDHIPVIDAHISNLLEEKPALLDFSKYGDYLPKNLQIELLKNKYFDIEQTKLFLKTVKMKTN